MTKPAWIQERRDPTVDEMEAWLEDLRRRRMLPDRSDMGTWNEPAWLAFLERNA